MFDEKTRSAVADTLTLIDLCVWELDRLGRLSKEMHAYNEERRVFLNGASSTVADPSAVKIESAAGSFKPDPKACLFRAEEIRVFSETLTDSSRKEALRELAETYDGVARRMEAAA